MGPVLRTLDPVILLKVGQHDDYVDALVGMNFGVTFDISILSVS